MPVLEVALVAFLLGGGLASQAEQPFGPPAGQRIRLSYRLPAVVLGPDHAMVYARLAFENPARLRELARNGATNPDERKQALLAWLNLCEPSFMPVAVELLGSPDETLRLIGLKAVEYDPARAWPMLIAGARAGSESCVEALAMYPATYRRPAMRAFLGHAEAKVRQAALNGLRDPEAWERALTDPSKPVREGAVRFLLMEGPAWRDRLYRSQDPAIRALAVRFTARWTMQDRDRWPEFVLDPSPEVRVWGLALVAPLATEWGYAKGEDADAILGAVEEALRGPPRIRATAVRVIRAWMLTWEEARRVWSPAHLALGVALFRSATVRTALYQEAVKADGRYAGAVYEEDLSLRDALSAFLMTEDPRAVPLVASKLSSETASDVFSALGRLGGRNAWSPLCEFAVREATRASPRDEYRYALRCALEGLRQIEPRGDTRPLVAALGDPRLGSRVRWDLAEGLALIVAFEELAGPFASIAEDRREREDLRAHIVWLAARTGGAAADRLLDKWLSSDDPWLADTVRRQRDLAKRRRPPD